MYKKDEEEGVGGGRRVGIRRIRRRELEEVGGLV